MRLNTLVRPVFINPSEIACVRSYLYHSFRPPIGEVILYNGTKIRTWEDAEEIARLAADHIAQQE